MDSIRSFFGRSKKLPRGNQALQGRSYETTAAGDVPVRGSYPVAGNGPNRVLEEIQSRHGQKPSISSGIRQSIDQPGRSSFMSIRGRRPQEIRPSTAPHSGFPSAGPFNGRTRSGFTTQSPPNFSRKPSVNETPTLRSLVASESQGMLSRGTSIHTTDASIRHTRHGSAFVDVFDAVSTISPSRSSSKHRASGKRDYGEDVADRNIKQHQGITEAGLDAPEYSYLRAFYGSSQKGQQPLRSDATSSTTQTREPTRPTFHSSSKSLGPTSPKSNTPQAHPLATSTTITDGDEEIKQPLRSRSKTSPAPVPPPQSVSPSIYADSLPPSGRNSARSHNVSRGAQDYSFIRDLARSPQYSARPGERSSSLVNRRNTMSVSEAAAATAAMEDLSLQDGNPRTPQRNPSSPPVPSLPSTISQGKGELQSASQASASSTSVDPIRSRGGQDISKGEPLQPTRSRHGSGNYSAFPRQNSKGANQGPAKGNIPDDVENNLSRANGRRGTNPEPFNRKALEGVVDLTNTTDTDVHTSIAPAVTHERVTPVVHHVTEEQITREIHTHDVIHRVQPIKQVEVLPTAHFIPHPTVPDAYIRVSEADLPPSRKGNWSLADRTSNADSTSKSPDSGRTQSLRGTTAQNSNGRAQGPRGATSQSRPTTANAERKYVSASGVPISEKTWQHSAVYNPPLYDNGVLATPSGVPRSDFNPDGDGRAPDAETEPLFNETGYGIGGMLPGLEEKSPLSTLGVKKNLSEKSANNAVQ